MAACEITNLPQGWCAHCTGTLGPMDKQPDDDPPPFYGPESKAKAKREIAKLGKSAKQHSQRRHLKGKRTADR